MRAIGLWRGSVSSRRRWGGGSGSGADSLANGSAGAAGVAPAFGGKRPFLSPAGPGGGGGRGRRGGLRRVPGGRVARQLGAQIGFARRVRRDAQAAVVDGNGRGLLRHLLRLPRDELFHRL